MRTPVLNFFGSEPERDLLVGRFNRVRTVDEVSGEGENNLNEFQRTLEKYRPTSMQKSPRMVPGADSDGLVAPKILLPPRAASSPSQTCIAVTKCETLKNFDHRDDRARRHVLDKRWEKWLGRQIAIVFAEQIFRGMHHLEQKLLGTAPPKKRCNTLMATSL